MVQEGTERYRRDQGGKQMPEPQKIVTCDKCGNRLAIPPEYANTPGTCPKCGGIMRTDILHRVEAEDPAVERTLAGLGVPPFDVVQVVAGSDVRFYRLDGDRRDVLGSCDGPVS